MFWVIWNWTTANVNTCSDVVVSDVVSDVVSVVNVIVVVDSAFVEYNIDSVDVEAKMKNSKNLFSWHLFRFEVARF